MDSLQINQDSEEQDYLSPSARIVSKSDDPQIDALYQKYKKGRLILQPDFQRQFVWDKKKASRLIESALLDIPLPIIYLSEDELGKDSVIDGQQRLTTFFSFIDGTLPDGTVFKLTGLQVLKDLNGKKYDSLPIEMQEKVSYCSIRVIKFLKGSDADLKFEVFERLNTGSISLNDQELRNCIYRGKLNDLVIELSKTKIYLDILGLSAPEKRMKDRELVLRFIAFYINTHIKYKSPIKRFLNNTLENNKNITDDFTREIKISFINACELVNIIFDKNAFKRFHAGDKIDQDGRWEEKVFNTSLYDILMYSFAKNDKQVLLENKDCIREAFIYLMATDNNFITSIIRSTSDVQAVNARFNIWTQKIQSIIDTPKVHNRFNINTKKELYDAHPHCEICQKRILLLDDATINNIPDYWKGNVVITEDAKLAHWYCSSHYKTKNENLQIEASAKSRIRNKITKPTQLTILDTQIVVKNWTDVLENVYNEASKLEPKRFEEFAASYTNILSKDENLLKTKRGAREGEIRTNRKLDNGYHLVVHHAAGAIIYYCDILMKYIGLDDDWMVS